MGSVLEKIEEVAESVSTPVRSSYKTVLTDPRSPTIEIDRTPIQVDDTVPSEGGTPINQLCDPRSPAEGYSRTPIVDGLSKRTVRRLNAKEEDDVVEEFSELCIGKDPRKHLLAGPRSEEPRPPLSALSFNLSNPRVLLQYKQVSTIDHMIEQGMDPTEN